MANTRSRIVAPLEFPLIAISHRSWLITHTARHCRTWSGLGLGFLCWSSFGLLLCLFRLRGLRGWLSCFLWDTTLLTLGFRLKAISIATTTAIVELTTLTSGLIKDPLEFPLAAFTLRFRFIADINLAWSLWSNCGFWLPIAACNAGLFAGKAILIATTAAVVELTTSSILGVIVPGEGIVGTLTNIRGNVANVLG